MNYGLIGEKLGHSFSAEIHAMLGDYGYELKEIPADGLEQFIKDADFKGINVTIPYKQAVIPYLDHLDTGAKAIGAVNTIVNKNGKLYGYNTDFFGMHSLLRRIGANPRGKKTLILGTGGTSKTALAVIKAMGGTEVYRVSRSSAEDAISYEEAVSLHSDASIIINTTPVGMYPNTDACPIDINAFPQLTAVADAVYNPLRSRLIQAARANNIPAEGGLFMLVAQAVRASEYFLGTLYDPQTVTTVYQKMLRKKENIVLIGMPSSGKSTVGDLLAAQFGRACVDTDRVIEANAGIKISRIFAEKGENAFRDIETATVAEVSRSGGVVIATGGGAVLREENLRALRQNGRLYFLDRPLEQLIPTEDRPLASSKEAIKTKYEERYGIYTEAADAIIENNGSALEAAERIIKEFYAE